MKIIVTGSSGFIGSYALPKLQQYFKVETVSLREITIDSIGFKDTNAILHLAGKAHQMKKINSDEYFRVNHRLTLRLANKAKTEGVSHFIFISSVKVFGDIANVLLNENSICMPSDPYGESKLAAEKGLLELVDKDFTVSIIRPPLVYGPNVKGNLEVLTKLIHKLPMLPFGNIQNERSMVFVGNLTALIIKIFQNPTNGIFIAGDANRNSTSNLVETMMKHMGVNKPNITLPKSLLMVIKYLKPSIYTRLFESYIIDNSSTNKKLSFIPPYSFDEGIKEMTLN